MSSSRPAPPRPAPAALAKLRSHWDFLTSLTDEAAVRRFLPHPDAASESAQTVRIESLEALQARQSADKVARTAAYNARRKSGGGSAEEDARFFDDLAALDGFLAELGEKVDASKLRLYFPPSRGYTYRASAPGVYLGVGDFWLSSLAAKFRVTVEPGTGAPWAGGGGGAAAGPPSPASTCTSPPWTCG